VPEISDVESEWYTWFSNPEITKYLTDRYWPNSKQRQLEFCESLSQNSEKLVLLIVSRENDELLGVCSLSNINWVHSFCDLSIVVVPKKHRTGATAIETFNLLIKIAFDKLNLRNIKCYTVELNKASLALQTLFGFKVCGVIPNLFEYDSVLTGLVISVLSKSQRRIRDKI